MRQASTYEQSQELKKLKNFPQHDLMMEYFWAADAKLHPLHMESDSFFVKPHPDVDIIQTWSLGKMIEGLPGVLFKAETDNEEDIELTYNLHICPEGDGKMAEVKYVLFDGSKTQYETEALDLADAVFAMIMKLKDNGYYQ